MKILIVEDNSVIAENIALYLKGRGYLTERAKDGEVALEKISSGKYDLLIIDRLMPNIDGLALVRMLQARNIIIPFLFLTALSKQVDKIEGLSLGADDYLVKPFDLQELALRIEIILRRRGLFHEHTNQIDVGNLRIDLEGSRVWKDGKVVDLSPKEFALLAKLITQRGKIHVRESLYEEIWGDRDVSPETLETINVHIAHLRKKLGSDLIRTVKLSGYIIDL